MVRLKHRYLLVNILYPESTATTQQARAKDVPDLVQFHHPTPDALTPQLLARIIRDTVVELFGDYGAGVLGSSLVGTCQTLFKDLSHES